MARDVAGALCWYSAERAATKLRWGLAVDEAERDGLQEIAAGCGGTDVVATALGTSEVAARRLQP
ncbi:hypothetical protein PV721_13970 [Streptomyces sp. MB09-01]|uniref:hypothetical protein n=1 Tax=Streptomyces sp. MB09-01 TaxID=3028666 RepID=UPI0029B5B7CF|nr:hypothetical protein [Streptomyces sp. MB09-01]MDX3535458.1 hypothetical protein [Streptomyces sp. MB09-01]